MLVSAQAQASKLVRKINKVDSWNSWNIFLSRFEEETIKTLHNEDDEFSGHWA